MRSIWPAAIVIITTLPCALQAKPQPQQLAVAVTNVSRYERTELVEVDSPFDVEKTRGVLITDGENTFAGQVVGDRIAFVARGISSKDCQLFWIKPMGSRASSRLSGKHLGLENEYLRVAIDEETGAVSGLYSKLAGRQFVAKNTLACAAEVTRGGKAETAKLQQIDLIESGPARATIRTEWEFGTASRIVQDLILCEGVPRIDVKVTGDWQEGPDAELKIAIPIAIRNAKSWFGSRLDEGGHNWVDVSGQDEGITVVGDGRVPVVVEDGAIQLLVAPAKQSKDGMIELRYSIFPHPGGFNPSLTEQIVDMSTSPLYAAAAKSATED